MLMQVFFTNKISKMQGSRKAFILVLLYVLGLSISSSRHVEGKIIFYQKSRSTNRFIGRPRKLSRNIVLVNKTLYQLRIEVNLSWSQFRYHFTNPSKHEETIRLLCFVYVIIYFFSFESYIIRKLAVIKVRRMNATSIILSLRSRI